MEKFLNTVIGSEPCEDGDSEDMKLPKEMFEAEGSLTEYVFKDNEDKQSFGTVMQSKEEKEVYKDISTWQNQNYILMKEKGKQSLWTVTRSEEKEDVTTEHYSVVRRNEMISCEEYMHPITQTVMNDGECLMLCSGQNKERMFEEVSTETSETHVFETDYWCMFAGIEWNEDRPKK